MATQSNNLEQIGKERRQQEFARNTVKKSNKYDENHELAHSTPGQVLGKGDNKGYINHVIMSYDEYTKDAIVPQVNPDNIGGGEYDINGRNGIGGRKHLETINKYGPKNMYSADLDSDIEDQFYIK